MKQAVTRLLAAVLPQRAKHAVFHLGAKLAPERFVELAFEQHYLPDMRLGLLGAKRRGLAPRRILDIGAYHGDWSRLAHSVWPEAEQVMVEGNHEKETRLTGVAADLGARLELALLGPEDGAEVEFTVMESGSSVLEERSGRDRRKEMRTLRALDALLPGQSFDMIKIDVQGFELEVFRGGARILGAAEAVLMELALIEVNEGAPLIDEVLGYMRERGFVSYEVLEIHRRPIDKAMNQIDILFIRQGSALLADQRHA